MPSRNLIEAARPNTAHLTDAELRDAYAYNFTGDMGLKRSAYVGKSSGAQDDMYLVLIYDNHADKPWMVTRFFVSSEPDGKLSGDFSGTTDFESSDESEASTFFDKEAHLRGGGDVKIPPKPEPRRFPPNGDRPYQAPSGHVAWSYRRPSGGDSPHWDGNRYAL